MRRLHSAANRLVNTLFAATAAGFAVAMAVYLVLAVYAWVFTDDSPAGSIGRAVGCLVFALGFKFLSRLDEYEITPATTTTTTTRRPARRRATRKA